jgi:maleate cis-trans isomerase
MFEEFLPKRKIGVLSPLPIIDNAAFEFYHMVPPDVMAVMIPVGLQKFTAEDVERVFKPIDEKLDMMMERGVDIVMQSGVPLPILIGVEAHDRLIAHMEEHTGLPATSSVLGVAAAARHLGIKKIALANKWTEEMNGVLGEFFAREGVSIAGVASRVLGPDQFQKMSSEASVDLAYEIGRRALEENPDADGLYIGGGAWLSQPVSQALEEEFDKPVYCNKTAMIWDTLHRVDYWTPIKGFGRLLAGD